MTTQPIRIETPRLIVRRFEERDIPDILDYSKHAEDDGPRRRNIGWQHTEESVRAWWLPMTTLTVEEAATWLALVIEAKALDRVVGNVGFNTQRIGEARQGMIGWTLGAAFEGRGYATEAASALVDHLFRTEGFHRLYAMTSPDNERSWRLMERLGMRREAHFVKNCNHDGEWVDEYLYAILAEEWRAMSPLTSQ
jgi:RimJ/RimL family protein N-acetyltransferase